MSPRLRPRPAVRSHPRRSCALELARGGSRQAPAAHLLLERSRSSPFGSRGSAAVYRRRGGRARLNDRCSADTSPDLPAPPLRIRDACTPNPQLFGLRPSNSRLELRPSRGAGRSRVSRRRRGRSRAEGAGGGRARGACSARRTRARATDRCGIARTSARRPRTTRGTRRSGCEPGSRRTSCRSPPRSRARTARTSSTNTQFQRIGTITRRAGCATSDLGLRPTAPHLDASHPLIRCERPRARTRTS